MGQILGPYVNHVGSTRDGAGNVFIAATQVRPGENNDAVVIMRRDVSTGAWSTVAEFGEAGYGKPGFCSLAVVVSSLHIIGSFRNAAGEQVVMEHAIPNVCVSWRDAIATQVAQALSGVVSGGNVGALAKAIYSAVAPFLPK